MVALAVDLQLGRVDAGRLVRDWIEHAGRFCAERKLRLGPDGAVAERHVKLREVARGIGRELVAFGLLPGDLSRAGAGQLNAAEIDELAELLSQAIEIEGGIGGELLERAGGFDCEGISNRIAVYQGRACRFRGEPRSSR